MLPIILGGMAVLGAGYVAKKVYEENQLAGERWGSSVTKEQDKVIKKSLELRDDATAHVTAFTDGVTGSADKVVEANLAIVDSIQSTIDKEYERATKPKTPECRRKVDHCSSASLRLQRKAPPRLGCS